MSKKRLIVPGGNGRNQGPSLDDLNLAVLRLAQSVAELSLAVEQDMNQIYRRLNKLEQIQQLPEAES